MEYTLDTAAIRRRFEQAIIGIRQDGTMAVLVPFAEGCDSVFDLVDGYEHYTEQFSDEFPTLIRPGDRCEVSARGTKWHNRMFLGFSGYADVPFGVRESDDHSGEYSAVIAFSHIRPLPAAEPATDSEATADEAALKRLWERGKEAWKNIGPSAAAWVDEMRGNAVEPEGEVPTLKPCIVCNGKADETRVYDTHCLNTQCPLYAISMSKEKWNAAVRPTEPMNYGAAALLRQAQEEIRRHKPADGPKPEDYESCPKCKSSFSFCRPFSDGVCPKCGHSLLGTAPAPEPLREQKAVELCRRLTHVHDGCRPGECNYSIMDIITEAAALFPEVSK